MPSATGSGFTLAEFFNVIRFQLDESSFNAVEQAVQSFKSDAGAAIDFTAQINDSEVQETLEGLKDTVRETTDNGEVPLKPVVDDKSSQKTIVDMKSLRSVATKILSGIGIAVGFANFRALTEEFNGINDSINYATQGLENQKEIQLQILQAANDCKASYGQLAGYAVKLSQQNKELFPIEDATEFTKLVAQVEQNAGNGDNLANVQTMLSMVFATGELSQSVLTRLARRAPEVVDILCKGLDVTREELDKLVESGKVSADDIKKAYMNSADSIQDTFDTLDYSISDGLLAVRNKWGYKLDEINVKFGITEKIAKSIVKISDLVINGFDKIVGVVEKVADAFGGVDNLLEMLTVGAVAFFAAWKGQNAINALKSIVTLVKSLNLSMLPVIAAVVGLYLAFEDLWTFVQGGDSFIGEALAGAGLDADAVRESILGAIDSIKSALGDMIRLAGEWWDEHGDEVISVFQGIGQFIFGFVELVLSFFNTIGETISALFSGDISGAIDVFAEGFQNALSIIEDTARKIFGDELVDNILGFISTAEEFLSPFFDWITGAFEKVGGFFSGVGDFFGNAGAAIGNFFSGSSNDAVGTVVESSPTSTVTNNENTVQQSNEFVFHVTEMEVADRLSGSVSGVSKKAADKLANDLSHTGR